jgi:acetyl esterase/lipase
MDLKILQRARSRYMSGNILERLDPELKAIVEAMSKAPPLPFDNIPLARKMARQNFAAMKQPDLPGLLVNDLEIEGARGAPAIRIRTYRPQKSRGRLPAMLWIHGGGYIFGDLDQEDALCRRNALAWKCVIVSVEYRLAPECHYPEPLEDCYTALKWLAANCAELKADSTRIAIGGASAGGGLAAGLSLLARDRAEVKSIFQLLLYPMLDDCNVRPAGPNTPDAIMWTRAANLVGWRSYLGYEPGGAGVACYASVCRAADLKGLPPTYITVGDLDLFAAENIEYARRLVQAGVSTELHVYPGGPHAFDMLAPQADIARRFTADIHHAVRKAWLKK